MSCLITLRTERKKKWTHLYLGAVEDPSLSWGAKGLHTYLMSRPPNWQIRYTDLLSRSRNKRTALKTLCRELKAKGYLYTSNNRDTEGRFAGTVWTIVETPELAPQAQFPSRGKTGTRKSQKTESEQGNNNHDYTSPRETTTLRINGNDVVVFSGSKEEYYEQLISPLLTAFKLIEAVEAAQSVLRSNLKIPEWQVWHAAWVLSWQVKKNNFEIKTTWEDVLEAMLRRGIRHPVKCPTPKQVIEKYRH